VRLQLRVSAGLLEAIFYWAQASRLPSMLVEKQAA